MEAMGMECEAFHPQQKIPGYDSSSFTSLKDDRMQPGGMSRVLDRASYQRSVGGLREQTHMEEQPSDQSQEEAYKEDDGEKCD